ncbi:MAG: acyl carrier protein [Deltaproteobacteria bacterium]|nr:acyl carrier protein [Deltaproteobacteria bacterium]
MADKLTRDTLKAHLFEVFQKHAQGKVTVTESSHITGDLGVDSLAVMEIVAELEDRYDMSFPDEELPKIRTVGDVIATLAKRLEADGRLA